MIQKAIVVERSTSNPYKYKVRIPVIHGLPSTPNCTRDDELPFAPICGMGGFVGVINMGDVVYVAFENGEFDTPVILGQLIVDSGVANISGNTTTSRAVQTNATIQALDFQDNEMSGGAYARLPEDTKIGNVSSFELSSLFGVKGNIQHQLNAIYDVARQSQGLLYTSSGDGTCYLSSIGTCTDSYIVIPPMSKTSDRVTAIGREEESESSGVFYNNTSIVGISIPVSVAYIGRGTFYGCSNLINIVYGGTTTQWGLIRKGTNWNTGTGEYTIHCSDGDIPKSQGG